MNGILAQSAAWEPSSLSKHHPEHDASRDDDNQDQEGLEERAQFSHGRHSLHLKYSAKWRSVKLGDPQNLVLNQKPDDPDGAGDLVEIALVSEPEAACPGAKVLRWWEA